MKKFALIAALGFAAILTACGDDDSSSTSAAAADGCVVTTTENSATATATFGGYSSSNTYTLTETGFKLTYGGYGADQMPAMDYDGSFTVADLKEMADSYCKAMNAGE